MKVAPAPSHVRQGTQRNYCAVAVAALKVCRAVDLDLYILNPHDEKLTLYRDANHPVTRDDFERLEAKGVHELIVSATQRDQVRDELQRNMEAILEDEEFDAVDRFQALQFAVEDAVQGAFRRLGVGEAVAQSQAMGKNLTRLLQTAPIVPKQLFQVMRHDHNTFTHVVNVASYCILLAKAVGIADEAELEAIATGGMLHDIGKRHIPSALLNKPGKLTEEEFDLIKQHPTIGYEELCGFSEVSHAQRMMAYQHHERMDGTGYPVGAEAGDIDPWAKLCAVVDVFDAVTGFRTYRKPLSRQAALELLEDISPNHLDEELVKCWTSVMGER